MELHTYAITYIELNQIYIKKKKKGSREYVGSQGRTIYSVIFTSDSAVIKADLHLNTSPSLPQHFWILFFSQGESRYLSLTGKPSHLLIYHQGKHDITVPALPIIYPRRSPCGTQSCTYVVGSRLRFLRKSQPAPKSRTQGLISICQQLPYLKLQDFFIFLFEGFFLKSLRHSYFIWDLGNYYTSWVL